MNERRITSEQGFTALEALAGIVLASIMALAVAMSTKIAFNVTKRTEVHYAASSLAASRIEQLLSMDTADLTSTQNESGKVVTWPGLDITFTRDTTVTVNADNSRTLKVKIASTHPKLPEQVTFTTTQALWE